MPRKSSYSHERRVIEIADYIFEHTEGKHGDNCKYFMGKYGYSRRTADRLIAKAREYNRDRVQEYEKIRNEEMLSSVRESIRKGFITRDEALMILSDIAKGKARKIEGQLFVPSDSERRQVIAMLFDKMGWDEKPKNDDDDTVTVSFG